DAQAQTLLLELLLERLPGRVADLRRTAVRADAQKDVAVITADAELVGDHRQRLGRLLFGHRRRSAQDATFSARSLSLPHSSVASNCGCDTTSTRIRPTARCRVYGGIRTANPGRTGTRSPSSSRAAPASQSRT